MRIEDIIPTGRENAIHQAELAKLLNVSPRRVKELVREARGNGVEILSGKQGYWLAKNDQERKAFIAMSRAQAITRLKTIKPIKDILAAYEGQITLTEALAELPGGVEGGEA